MGDLAAFLAARLDEDEAAAKAACEANWYLEDRKQVSGYGDEFTMATLTSGDAAHIARHDPARVLREVEAKREILRECEAVQRLNASTGREPSRFRDWLLRHLAAVYRDHPDYSPVWGSLGAASPRGTFLRKA